MWLVGLGGACWCSSCVYVVFNDRDDVLVLLGEGL